MDVASAQLIVARHERGREGNYYFSFHPSGHPVCSGRRSRSSAEGKSGLSFLEEQVGGRPQALSRGMQGELCSGNWGSRHREHLQGTLSSARTPVLSGGKWPRAPSSTPLVLALPLPVPTLESPLWHQEPPRTRGGSSPAAGAAQGSAFPLRQKVFMTRKDFGTDNPQSPILSSRDNVML